MATRNTFFVLLFLPWWCFPQKGEALPLKLVLDQIASIHQVRFSYIDEELAVYRLAAPEAKLSLVEKFAYIEQHTRLRFKAVSNNYYSIYNDQRMDKPLCGYLIDATTGLGIENAEIRMAGLASASASDANGYFELAVLAPNKIEVRHMGYKPKTLDPQDLYVTGCPKIPLEAITAILSEVNTQRYLATGISKTGPAELTVRPGKFGILPGLTTADILQTMQQVPGILSVDETVSNINVRGGTHDQNLFLWNGIRMFQTGHFFGMISAFNPLLATKISIYKNGSPSFFGESVSSLVNISTHTNVLDSCYNAVSVDMINANFLSKIRLSNKATLQVAGRRTFTDIFTSPTFRNYQSRMFQNTVITDVAQNRKIPVVADENFYFYDFSVQYHQKIGARHEMIVDGIGIENNVDIVQQTALARRNSNLAQRNFGGSLDWKSQWNDTHISYFQGYFSWYTLEASNEAIVTSQTTQQSNMVFDKGFTLRHKYVFSEKTTFEAGYHLDEISVANEDFVDAPPFSSYGKAVSVSHAFAVDADYRSANGNTQLHGGIRQNYFEKYGVFLVEPRLVFSQALSDGLRLELVGERKSQTLSQVTDRQQDFLGIEKRRWTLADESGIPIQKSSQVSLGFTYAKHRWLVTLDNFYKKVSGITSHSQGFQNQFEFIDATANYKVFGSEVLLQRNFTKFYTWVSYSFSNNHYEFESIAPSQFPNNFLISHAVSWAGIYEWRKLRIAVGAKWHTGKPVTIPAGYILDVDNAANSQIVYDAPNGARLDDYVQVNCSASKSWRFGKNVVFTASASVVNVLNRENIINRYYRINTDENTVEVVNTFSLARTPDLSLKVLF